MVCQWEPGTQYDIGSVVEYEGHRYKIIQPHRSQSDWTPPVTPALWGRLPQKVSESGQNHDQKPHYQGSNSEDEKKQWHERHTQKVEIHPEEQKKHWYDIDEHRKKQLEVGGAFAAGLGLLGAGYYAYHAHEKSEEEKKAQVWGLQNWLKDARARAEKFHNNGPQAPVTWLLTNGRNIPPGALSGGNENGQTLFIARAFHEGGIQVGKASSQFQQGAVIGFKHKEFQVGTFEVLVGNEHAVKWVNTYGHLNPENLGCTLVEGGREPDGSPLYIAQAEFEGGVHPGKASKILDGAYIPYGGTEERVKEYHVLAYA